ncbi:MAG: isoleucine--tRNA ligase [Holosporales bacterium]|jgi:isoleucyl-tRNA synthetase|nr:isoleucine--tRNA ligase [Holosporales bacterium]
MATNDDVKKSVFLPTTNFPLKADLCVKEREILEKWETYDLYGKLRIRAEGLPKFVLHYGPPYANGAIHIGHAFTEGLKDIFVKTYQMYGYNAALIPGWDCHGLPIEWKIEEDLRKKKINKDDIPICDFLKNCRQFAEYWIEVQQNGLKRLGICADWNGAYRTMDFTSESVIVERFLQIFMNGFVYQGKKPVMWSVVEKTAMAEAEVEYHDHFSTAVYVVFPVISSSLKKFENSYIVIWTTTPWTLPANRAIAYNSDIKYVLLEVKRITQLKEKSLEVGQKLIVAHDLVKNVCASIGLTDYLVLDEFMGIELKDVVCQHPFDLYDKQTETDKMSRFAYTFVVPLIGAKHVTSDVGTGLVHTAPSYGIEDFVIGKEYGIPMPDIVQADGTYVDDLPIFSGKHIFKVDSDICDVLRNSKCLLAAERITHSYPHSWRSKSPLIFRLTNQWFFDIEKIRSKVLNAIDKVNWFPSQSKNRIKGMIESRPDWCLSRQRVWGVPLTLFVSKETNEPLKDDEVNAKIVSVIKAEGIEAWYKYDADFFLPPQYANQYEKVTDILDVWFDSACTHHFVLENNNHVKWPADVYLEGSDQHRGWFQSSLIESIATKGTAPYQNVVTHGFILDQSGRKMSKSLGNVISCEDVIDHYGADLLRLWIVNMDYTEDVKLGQEILKRQEDIYKRFRNTLRYLLGSINDFSSDNVIEYNDMPELEQYILYKVFVLSDKHKACIKNFDLASFYSELHVFCTNELSAFYFDIRKDSLYCDDFNAVKRRSAQTVMDILFQYIACWLAPVLSFTTEEAWQYYRTRSSESIHEQSFPNCEIIWNKRDLAEKWKKIREVRRVITNAIEQERLAKTITSSLQGQVVLFVTKDLAKLLKDIDMAELAIISSFSILVGQPPAGAVTLDEVPGVGVIASSAQGTKCVRCWKFCKKANDLQLCDRCASVIVARPHQSY